AGVRSEFWLGSTEQGLSFQKIFINLVKVYKARIKLFPAAPLPHSHH
ncbi:MAG: hypothetical protein ACI92B_002317, partial [Marinobacter maritimus]